MLPACGVPSLIGYDRLHIRKRVIKLLEEAGAYRGSTPHALRVPVCSRSGSVIEPMLQPQWYLRMKPLAEKVKEVTERDILTFVPESPNKLLWGRWLDGIQDWCLSRQIWWGHRIPAYQVVNPAGETVRWVAANSQELAEMKLTDEERAGNFTLQQDEDVLDTWFSSGLLPLTTAGWRGSPKRNLDGWKSRYPLSFIESGGDILFFWIARMAMLCTHFTGSLPFPEIILHPLVCDSNGKKMSKSVGNVLDPLMVIYGRPLPEIIAEIEDSYTTQLSKGGPVALSAEKEIRRKIKDARKAYPVGIAQSGADSLRMALIDYTRQTRQINMELRRVDVFRKLAVKLDNAFRVFRERSVSRKWTDLSKLGSLNLQPHDLYILDHLGELIDVVDAAFKNRKLFEATEALRAFTYDVFCGVYLEFVKEDIADQAEDRSRRDTAMTVLQQVLDTLLCLLHPFMPHQTEALWQELNPGERIRFDKSTIMKAYWPMKEELLKDSQGRESWDELLGALQLVSLLRSLDGKKRIDARVVVPPKGPVREFVRSVWPAVERLGRVGVLQLKLAGEEDTDVNGWVRAR